MGVRASTASHHLVTVPVESSGGFACRHLPADHHCTGLLSNVTWYDRDTTAGLRPEGFGFMCRKPTLAGHRPWSVTGCVIFVTALKFTPYGAKMAQHGPAVVPGRLLVG